jgi:oligopeptide transport system substrate-binding protein
MKCSYIRRALMTAVSAAIMASAASGAVPEDYVSVTPEGLPTLNYLKDSKTEVMQLGYNTVDGLVEFDRFGLIMPSMATDWTISDDHRTYTFHIRKGVNWYTCDGKEYAPVTAHDFEAGIRWGLNKKNASGIINTVYDNIVGAKDYYLGNTTDWNSVGVKVLDDYTIQYTFIRPLPYALRIFSFGAYYPVCQKFLDEVGDDFGTSNENMLYCGAYILTDYEPEYQRVLTANPHYWNREAISIQRIVYKYNKEADANGPELFTRGEISEVRLPGTIMDEWMNDPEKKKLMHPDILTNVTYFMAYNFEPKYDEKYAPKDWVEAVNNLNFRKALFHGLDRVAALIAVAPYDYKRRLSNTLTRPNLVQVKGVDYTMMDGLKAYTEGESFNPELAVQYKKKAMEELRDKVTFPIKVVMPYSTGLVDDANQAQVIEQQMEKLLGTDFIDIILQPYPATGFNKAVRTAGKFSFMRLRWGPDYADPLSAFDPVMKSAIAPMWSRIYLARDYVQPDGRGKFEAMADEANAEVLDVQKRYELFAKAETFLLDNAFVIPMYLSGGGYIASYVDPFSSLTGQWGNNGLRKLKGAKLLDHPMGMEEYAEAEKKYLAERDEARRNAKYE